MTQTGDNTAGVREFVRSDRILTVKMMAVKVNVSWETIRLRSGAEINLCQDGAQQSHTATAECTVEHCF